MIELRVMKTSNSFLKAHPSQKKLTLFIAIGILLILLPWIVSIGGGNYWVRVLDFALLYTLLALGLNIVVGFAGLLDLGYIAFYAVGAYSAALLTSPHLAANFIDFKNAFPQGMHVSYWLIIPVAALIAAGFGAILGAPTLKLRGDYLAIVTLGFGEIVRIFMNNLDRPLNLTNGPKGINGIDAVSLGGVSLGKTFQIGSFSIPSVVLNYYLFVVLVVIVVMICGRLQRSRIGRAWVAIREDEIAAKAMGINTRNLKLLAFAIGASFGGLSGALFASFQGFISPESFSLWESIIILAMVVLGGMGHIPGVILGSLLLTIFPEVLRASLEPLQRMIFGKVLIDSEVIRQLLYGLALILVMRFRPKGLWPENVAR
ncbi:MAG: ABC transporter ATP-binding protein [Betaproteobacteria bacterium]